MIVPCLVYVPEGGVMASDSRKWKRWLASAVGVLAVMGAMGSCGGRDVPTVVGAELPQAVQTLKGSGFA